MQQPERKIFGLIRPSSILILIAVALLVVGMGKVIEERERQFALYLVENHCRFIGSDTKTPYERVYQCDHGVWSQDDIRKLMKL